ncbi:MAG: phytochelatin synthase family protein [Myxococcota bacterium]|nr:phytochelatin synthase family protein [Myxococcota bacterium]
MTRGRKLALGGAAALALAIAVGGGALAYVSQPDARYAEVASIEGDAWFHDAPHLDRAWELPVAATYRPAFDSQGNGSFCGPTSVVNVVRSLGGAADQAHVLEGTSITTIAGILPGGITLDQLADLARTRLPERAVTVHRDLDLASFRALMRRANDPDVRVIVNFHRGPLFARGGGHHSPIGGYLEDEDLVFVLDVNDDYDPWLARTERLFAAIDTVDPTSGLERGVLVIEPRDAAPN